MITRIVFFSCILPMCSSSVLFEVYVFYLYFYVYVHVYFYMNNDPRRPNKWENRTSGWAEVGPRVPKVSQWAPKVSERAPKVSQKGAKREPKGTKSEPKGPKGRQRWAKGRPKCIPKSISEKRYRNGVKKDATPVFWGSFWSHFPRKRHPKIDAQIDVKKNMKFHEKS